ncbi:MAG: esterase/lipase/thioesterase family active site protein [Herminiimonas sp.]|nr:esterase/lipase/thioesterase family active site protein [Herminiimonas sp.]
MSRAPGHPPAQPFFLRTASGNRYCIYHAPDPALPCKGVLLHVHAFGEEMNKVRRMTALQARMASNMGFGVLQIDLFGCGDSAGEFGDARWQIWKDDLAVASAWLQEHVGAPISLWGVRLGALLAMDYAASAQHAVDALILWQPVTSGESFMTQFLRLRLANRMLEVASEKNNGTKGLRSALQGGESLEVAGYEIAPELAAAIDALDALKLAPAAVPIQWFEVMPEAGRALAPARARVFDTLTQRGCSLQMHIVAGPAFWSTQETTVCPELLAATAGVLEKVQR